MTTPNVKDLLALINTIAPFELAEDWDNCGLQCGDLSWPAENILISLDISPAVLNESIRLNADVIVTHHPLFLSPSRQIHFSQMPGLAVQMAAQHSISIISIHTNLDKAAGGLNDYFSSLLGIRPVQALVPSGRTTACMTDEHEQLEGFGRIGLLEKPLPFLELTSRVKDIFNLPYLRFGGNTALSVSTVAVCTGSGSSLVQAFIKSGAQVFITGDMKYHEARQIEEMGLGFIDVGHFGSEHIVVDLLLDRLRTGIGNNRWLVEIGGFKKETDPFIIE